MRDFNIDKQILCFLIIITKDLGLGILAQGDEEIIPTTPTSTPERRYACWGSFGPPVVSAQCPRNTVIQVLRAGLKVQARGGDCVFSDKDCGCEYGQLGCNMPNVRDLCMGKTACRLDVMQQYINTDTCRGFSGYMYIEFNCVSGQKNSITDICSTGEEKEEVGFIRSYPGSFQYKQECVCQLQVPEDNQINLSILDFHTTDYNCANTKLLISHGDETDSYCGQNPSYKKKITPGSNQVEITLKTTGLGSNGGFWLQYEGSMPVSVSCKMIHRSKPSTTPAPTTTSSSTTLPTTLVLTTSTTKQSPTIQSDKGTHKPRQRTSSQSRSHKRERNQLNPDYEKLHFTENEEAQLEGTERRAKISPYRTAQGDKEESEGRSRINSLVDRQSDQMKEKIQSRRTNEGKLVSKLNDVVEDRDVVDKRPWWWRFTSREDKMSRSTPFPPWVKEIPASEMPLFIRKSAKPSEKNGLEDGTEKSHTEERVHILPDAAHQQVGGISIHPGSGPPRRNNLSTYANGNGLRTGRNSGEGESMTVTIIAVCVIGSILLIIIVGIVVRFVINKADPNYAMRQHHKKECIMRRNVKRQRQAFGKH